VRSLRDQGDDVVDLGGGEPEFKKPDHVAHDAIEALSEGDTQYTPSRGTKALLQAVEHKYQVEQALRLIADKNVIITPSAKH
ncbi:aspartate transaminase, partial [Pseudomonas syringae pv. tagetis]|uniref:aminotransferase class I/II-fold pyridoxal phosphate-dependent enzyme n=1 Tax=Pseudomonas syringae group genomosp. 7 TaxID=251699 RepID=UPI0037700BD1